MPARHVHRGLLLTKRHKRTASSQRRPPTNSYLVGQASPFVRNPCNHMATRRPGKPKTYSTGGYKFTLAVTSAPSARRTVTREPKKVENWAILPNAPPSLDSRMPLQKWDAAQAQHKHNTHTMPHHNRKQTNSIKSLSTNAMPGYSHETSLPSARAASMSDESFQATVSTIVWSLICNKHGYDKKK